MGQIEEKLLKDFIKANKVRKEKLAKQFGFDASESYHKHLHSIIESTYTSSPKPTQQHINPKETPIIHIVNLLDNSVSMRGDKFREACNVISNEILELKKATDVDYKYSLYAFRYVDNPYAYTKYSNIKDVLTPSLTTDNSTPLYATICHLAKDVLDILELVPDQKVLVKIFTDGENNRNEELLMPTIDYIRKLQNKGITVTFVGTRIDVQKVINIFHIDESNTLIHDNTEKGIKDALEFTTRATESYTKNVLAGKDVQVGFYKNVK